MQATVTLYKNTNFDLTNIPESASLLQTFDNITCNFVYTKQIDNLTTIKVDKTYLELLNIDYCKLNDVYYFVSGIHMINDNCASISLIEDALTTLGGINNINILDGWCTRRCVTSDKLFENTIPEDFSPSSPFVLEYYSLLSDYDYNDCFNIVLSTVDLTSPNLYLADIYVGDASLGDYSVSVPKLPTLATETTIGMRVPNGLGAYKILYSKYPNIGIFDFDDITVKESIQSLRGLGLESVIVGCYKIPKVFIYNFVRDTTYNGKITELTTNTKFDNFYNTETNVVLSTTYGSYEPNNAKVFANFNNITVFNIASGDSNTYDVTDFIHDNEALLIPSFTITADASKNGCVRCKPTYYRNTYNTSVDFMLDSVKGSGWINTPIAMSEASGNIINDANYSLIKGQGQADWDSATYQFKNPGRYLKAAGGMLSSASSGISGAGDVHEGSSLTSVTGGFSAMFNTGGNIATYDPAQARRNYETLARDAQQKILSYEISQNVVAPSISFGQDVNFQLYLGLCFYACSLRLSEQDLERFDKYLTRFGYKVSEILTKECFFGRQNFNFVEATGVSITSNSVYASRERRIRAAQQLESGVRIWHVKPTEALMYTNPIST